MTSPLVSVIVPLYNAEMYIERALNSVLQQTYSNWEVVVVNDGSTDGSQTIVERFRMLDKRFNLINQQNMGRSEARNTATRHVRGEYVIYLDADDFLHPQLMEICVNCALRDGSDIVSFTYDHIYRLRNRIRQFMRLPECGPIIRRYCNPEYFVTDNIYDFATEESHSEFIKSKWAVKHCQAWRCMYHISMIEGIVWPAGIEYEDVPWGGAVLLRVKRATLLRLPLYFYYPNPTSYIISSDDTEKAASLKTALDLSLKVYENAPEYKAEAWKQNFVRPFATWLEKHGF